MHIILHMVLLFLGGGSLDIKSADTHDTTYAIFIAKISSLIMSILLQLPAKPKYQEMKQFEVKQEVSISRTVQ